MLTRHRNPVAESFHFWMSQYPETAHPNDMERFYVFVNTAIAHRAKSWLDTTRLEARILAIKPGFDRKWLDRLMCAVENIHDARRAGYLRGVTMRRREAGDPADSFLEVRVTDDGKTTETWRPMSEY